MPALQEFVALGSAAQATEAQQALAKVASVSIERIETWAVWSSAIETIFRGVSLSSILLIMSVGLAIVFGLMGVINMAHGELMMVGAYATFITQELFKAFLPTAMFDYYFAAAMPMAFLVAAACGMVLELTVIRFLYGRPLETMLATWGISLVLMQAARVYFGDLTAVVAPSWLSGGVQVMIGVYLPNNRLFIIALSFVCVLAIYAILFRSGIGLRVRAVMQNRNMSACLGIPTRKVDAYTFAFGSGLAGVAGMGVDAYWKCRAGTGTKLYRRFLYGRRNRRSRKTGGHHCRLTGYRRPEQTARTEPRGGVWQGMHSHAGYSLLAVATIGAFRH